MADELRSALELAIDDELRELTDVLFRRGLNPLDYLGTPEPIEIQSYDRQRQLDILEQRFRFLAADGFTVLCCKTNQILYRDILIQVCRYLKVSYKQSFSATDLEAEIFLTLLHRAWQRMPKAKRQQVNNGVQQALTHADLTRELPEPWHKAPVELALKSGSVLTVNTVVRPLVLRFIAQQFARHFAQYQLARQTLAQGGAIAATRLQTHIALQTAGRGMTLTTARYATTRTVFSFLGPALWAWLLADLGWRTISTNYSRVIPAVFALAQIRLTRTELPQLV